ncbi:uncharacterized protein LOC131234565 [Magnolia sinica]|uniref:uncharacterized protein LOC131234565 n=1 Tax=Magnolia sinica TaxID=86752 RepID=UPI002659B222|nr:uncharacterized protein LOC131234565 [Magnolia sinica]
MVRGFSLFVGNISYDTNQKDLSRIFGKYGKLSDVFTSRDEKFNCPRGFAFVRFLYAAYAYAAMGISLGQTFLLHGLQAHPSSKLLQQGIGFIPWDITVRVVWIAMGYKIFSSHQHQQLLFTRNGISNPKLVDLQSCQKHQMSNYHENKTSDENDNNLYI